MKFLSILLVLTATVSFAKKELSFEEFKESCHNPRKFQSQRAPQQIQIKCDKTETRWDVRPAGSAGDIALDAGSSTIASLVSDKYTVAEELDGKDSSKVLQLVSCNVSKEYKRSYSFERPLSCEQVKAAGEASMVQICEQMMERMDVSWEPTGATASSCSSSVAMTE